MIRHNGTVSKSAHTRLAIRQFAANTDQNLERIYRTLLRGKYEFQKTTGVALERKGKRPRPLVLSSIPDRIVQRSILDRLQGIDAVKELVQNPGSYGALPGRSVRDAIARALEAHSSGAQYYIRSDIKDFFTKVPRVLVLERLGKLLPDDSLTEILHAASNVELENLSILRKHPDLFPTYEIGVAQGCCLSPLMGNVLLADFDKTLNTGDLVCIRYVDDFVLLGPSETVVREAFEQAKELLNPYGMVPYDPFEDRIKAGHGPTGRSYEFLGCIVGPGTIGPSGESVGRLKQSLRELTRSSLAAMSRSVKSGRKVPDDQTLTYVLRKMNDILRSWGNQYAFCNMRDQFKNVDEYVHRRISEYLAEYARIRQGESSNIWRRLLGVHVLADSKYDPL